MTHWKVREQRRRYSLTAAAGHRQALLASRPAVDEGPQERKVIREVLENAFEISFQAGDARPRVAIAPIAPLGELPRHDLLNRLSIREVRGTARAGPDEIVLAQREACRQIGRFDQTGDARVPCRREAQPIPAALDHFAERTNCNAFAIDYRQSISFDIAEC
jgi:hypothetical protein